MNRTGRIGWGYVALTTAIAAFSAGAYVYNARLYMPADVRAALAAFERDGDPMPLALLGARAAPAVPYIEPVIMENISRDNAAAQAVVLLGVIGGAKAEAVIVQRLDELDRRGVTRWRSYRFIPAFIAAALLDKPELNARLATMPYELNFESTVRSSVAEFLGMPMGRVYIPRPTPATEPAEPFANADEIAAAIESASGKLNAVDWSRVGPHTDFADTSALAQALESARFNGSVGYGDWWVILPRLNATCAPFLIRCIVEADPRSRILDAANRDEIHYLVDMELVAFFHLKRLSGENYGLDAGAWQAWYDRERAAGRIAEP